MRLRVLCLAPALLLFSTLAQAQQDLAITVGGLHGPDRTSKAGPVISFSTGKAIQANYSRYFKSYKHADLYLGMNVLFSPPQNVTSTLKTVTADFSTLYLTPAVKLKFYPKRVYFPWIEGGGGYALYRSSSNTLAGAANAGSGSTNSHAFMFGGGIDLEYHKKFALRLEAREFLTRSVNYNTPVHGRGQFNFVIGGGIVFHLDKK